MKQYLLSAAIVALLISLATGLFNFWVDPYGIYHHDRFDEQEYKRRNLFKNFRTAKPWYVLRARPSAIVVGTSRSATINPEHPLWKLEHGYNFSIPGMRTYEMLRFVEHANAVKPLSKLMIGLDFEMLAFPDPKVRSGFSDSGLFRSAGDLYSFAFLVQKAKDIGDTIFSLEAAFQSLAILATETTFKSNYRKNGAWTIARTLISGPEGFVFAGKNHAEIYEGREPDLAQNMEVFTRLLQFAHENNIETRIFITPEHVFMIDFWQRLGLIETWRDFHTQLVSANDSVAFEMGRPPFPLCGFNLHEEFVSEPIKRAVGSFKPVFNDGFHFNHIFGDVIMDAAWGKDGPCSFQLDAGSVETYLDGVLELRNRFLVDNEEEAARLRGRISSALESTK